MYRRSNRPIARLNTQLLKAVENGNVEAVQRLLESGANPNATCHVDFVSACHIAAYTGDGALSLLLKHGAEKNRPDHMGRTPLHITAWAGHVRHLGLLLEFPEAIQNKIEHGEVTLEVEEEVKTLSPYLKHIVNTRCEFTICFKGEFSIELPEEWRDSVDHCCKIAEQLPFIQPGWTPLHTASYSARHHCVRLLLAAGAEPCLRDVISRTPLDVAGSAYYVHSGHKPFHTLPTMDPRGFTEVISMLLAKECQNRKIRVHTRTNLHTALHIAVELESLESISLLLEAGACPTYLNREGYTPLHVCVKKRLKPHLMAFIHSDIQYPQSQSALIVNVRDKDGYTVLHSSILSSWLPGVCLSLEAGANIISSSSNGETSLHSAADIGQLDILKEILIFAKEAKVIDKPNNRGETALFKAVRKGNIKCANLLLQQGASIEITLPDKRNVFHVAAAYGLYNMLKFLLDYNYTLTRAMVNHVTDDDRKGYGPIHFAVAGNHIECVKLILSQNAYINLKTTCGVNKGSTPLHLAARKNNIEIVKLILKNNDLSIHLHDDLGWNALHTACYYASRDVIKLLLDKGSDLSAYTKNESKNRQTAIQMIMNNLSKPTEFIHEILDSYTNCNDACPQDPNYEVTVDYKILTPNKRFDPECSIDIGMKVIEAILKTGNSHDQKRLLIHPLVESFLCLKWEALLPFFYTMLVLYGLFVMALTCFIISVYQYPNDSTLANDTGNTTIIGVGVGYSVWSLILHITIALILLQEILYFNISRRYFLQIETWVKFSSIVLAILLPTVVYRTQDNWPRHFATTALLLSWLQMTFLLSRFPKWGYYVLMFRKVSIKVVKILLTFVFLIIGFALSFMIEYQSNKPFENPWAAFVKTMVMMTSEFDYYDLIDKQHSNTSLIVTRLLFLTFLILAAIVLMNLMVAVAVNDLNDLQILGNIMRLEKQVEFLASLETLVNVKLFMKILPKKYYKLKFARSLPTISLKPCEPRWSYSKAIPAHVREAIIDKGQSQKEKINDEVDCDSLQKKMDLILESISNVNQKPSTLSIGTATERDSDNCVTKHDLIVVEKQMQMMNQKLETVLHYIKSLKSHSNEMF